MASNKTLFTLFFCLFLCACTHIDSYQYDDAIDRENKKEVHALVADIFKAFNANDPARIRAMASKKFVESADFTLDSLIHLVKDGGTAVGTGVLNEYYISGNMPMEFNIGQADYTYTFIPVENESYLYLGTYTLAYNSADKFIISCLFNKEGTWKLSGIYLNLYAYQKRTAVEEYYLAKTKYEAGDLVGAFLHMEIEKVLSTPTPNFHYKQEKNFRIFGDKVLQKMKQTYPLPITPGRMQLSPAITGIYTQFIGGKFYPIIVYRSTIDILDTIALKHENDALHGSIEQTLPGIYGLSDTIFYRAISTDSIKYPSGKYYGFLKHK